MARGSPNGQAVTSCAQDSLWLLDLLVPHSRAARICRVYQISGDFDVDALQAAWHAVVDRHEILRTTLIEVDGRPMQKIVAEAKGSFAFNDLSAQPDRDSYADRYCAELATEAVSLADGPLARLTVLRLTADSHRAVLVLHRTIVDDRSVSILVKELSACYAEALEAGTVAPPPGPLLQYADYTRWQRDREAGLAFRRDWWTSALTPPPPLVLPMDTSARPATHGSGMLRFDWGADVAGLLADLHREEEATPLVVLLAAFQALLHRYAGAGRVTVGVPVPVRPQAFAGLIGPFDNLIVLTGDLTGSPTFRELVRRVAGAVREALDNRPLPFNHLVRALNADGDPRGVPLCDAILVVREEPEAELALAGAEVLCHEVDTGSAAADLTLAVERVEDSVAGTLTYRDDVFEAQSAVVVLEQLRTLLAAGLSAPDTLVADLPLDDPDRVRATAAAADQIGAAVVAEDPVHELFRRTAELMPDAEAVSWSGGSLTYAELERHAAQITGYLDELGAKGSPVAIRMAPGPGQLAASLGVLRAGAHMVWFGTGDAGERGRAVLDELRPICMLREGDPAGDELANWFGDELGGRVVDIAALDHESVVPSTGGPVPQDELAYVAYTSGSTGKPKGVAQSHGAFTQFVTWLAGALDIRPGSRIAQWAAPEHDQSLCEAFATLTAGGTLCPVPEWTRAHPEGFVDWLVDSRITFLRTVPSFAKELLKVIKRRGDDGPLDSLERLVLMGEVLPPELVDGFRAALPGVRVANVYGSTETIAATWHDVTGPVGTSVPIGRSIPGRQVLVLDGADRPCPIGVTGEIVIRSPYVARGYVGNEAGSGAFRPVDGLLGGGPGWVGSYRTGDLARRRWDGLLEFRGRRDLQVKLYGTRVELADVEAALAEHESVAECAVVPLTDSDGLVIQLVAYVVARRTPAGDAVAGADEWRAHLRRRFGTSMLLVSFETLSSSLPRNVGGKVDRRRLAAVRAR